LKLLGRFWPAYEIIYVLFLLLVLAVIGSAAGILLEKNFNIPYIFGVFFILIAVGFLTFRGSGVIEKFLSGWSIILYIVYAAFLVTAILKFGPAIRRNFIEEPILSGWALGGFKYALYNMGVIPAVFFCLRHIKKRREAVTAGFLGGLIGILPGLFFYIAIAGLYRPALEQEVPSVFLLQKISFPFLLIIFQVVLFGTLIETGTGIIHSVNERIHAALKAHGKDLKNWQRPVVAAVLLLIGLGLSMFGLIDLISKGYGTISWGFFAVYIIPLITIGIIKIKKNRVKKNIG
jgi:uncharacterized membrane protein YkvI